MADPITVMQLEEQRADHVVEPGTQAAAGDHRRPSAAWVEEQPRPRSRSFEQNAGGLLVGRSHVDATADPTGVDHEQGSTLAWLLSERQRRRKTTLAERIG